MKRSHWVLLALIVAPALLSLNQHVGSRARAGEKADASLDWQIPNPRFMFPFAKQQPMVFVSTQTPAEWTKLRAFWNPTLELATDPVTGEKVQRTVVKIKLPLGLAQAPKVPVENPMTVERWELGRRLYFDKVLSSDGSVSCASCHDPRKGFTDQSPVSTGISGLRGGVSAPTVLNSAYNFLQFWDGRAVSLEDQCQGPPQNPVEMHDGRGHAWNEVVRRVRKKGDYTQRFLEAFGTQPTRDAIAMAIATYERTVLTGNSIHDRAEKAMRVRVAEEETGKFELQAKDYGKVLREAVAAKDENALSALGGADAAKLPSLAEQINQGRILFFGKARCSLCHVGENFTDGQFHNLGVGVKDGKLPADAMGRYAQLPTGHKNPEMMGAFKTPPLRSLVSTAPYLHDGSEGTLEKVIDFYDRGGNANEFLSPKMRDLDAEKAYYLVKKNGTAYKGPEAKLFGDKAIVPMKLNLTTPEKAALVLFLRSLQGEVDPLVMDPYRKAGTRG
jgi:cytochrome c peroxidase